MKYVNILLIGLVLLFPGCTFLDVVPEGNIESIESNFEKRDQTENWFKYCHFWVSPFTTSVISNPAYMGLPAAPHCDNALSRAPIQDSCSISSPVISLSFLRAL